jgi:hypothetical protein
LATRPDGLPPQPHHKTPCRGVFCRPEHVGYTDLHPGLCGLPVDFSEMSEKREQIQQH